MSNVFNIKEVEKNNTLIPINTPGVEKLLKKGAKVKFRSDLKIGKDYGAMSWLEGPMSKALSGKATITSIMSLGTTFQCKEFPCFYYSREMLEGVYFYLY